MTPEEEDEERRLDHAYQEFVERSVSSQNGWAHKGGPRRHFTPEQRLEVARLRGMVRLFELRLPPPPPDNPDMPF